MTRAVVVTLTCLLVSACSSAATDGEEPIAVTEQALDVTKPQTLTRKQNYLSASGYQDETLRENNTSSYYETIGFGADGSMFCTASGQLGCSGDFDVYSFLSTLQGFRNRYFGDPASERIVYYYNRGDLGIGREMHCQDTMQVNGEIACYVTNFAAGDDGSEFTFGFSSNIAFANMHANHSFATVAMVYRDRMPANAPNKVFFLVYDKNGNIQNFAALDRIGILFEGLYAQGLSSPSVPGVNFNNHIPSNCVACHGGQPYGGVGSPQLDPYYEQVGGLFLPFDLDQFEYEDASGRTRGDQLATFKHLNEMVWKVSARSGSDPQGSVRAQLDGWYNNTQHQSDSSKEVFENDFNSAFVPAGWQGYGDVYQSVVRTSCRNCHMTNNYPFATESQFRSLASLAASDICGYQMPHALQVSREFWLSNKPIQLENYWRAVGQTAAADQLHGCGPSDVATLDPQIIMAVLGGG